MPKLIIFSGLPCVGKSALAEALSKKLRIPIFSVDPIESAVIKSGINKSFETGLSAYLVAQSLASEQFKNGLSVIIDASNAVKEGRAFWDELVENNQVNKYVIECVLDSKIHQQRVEKRNRNLHGIPEVTWEYVEEWRKKFEPWREVHLTLNTSDPVETNIKKILKYLDV